MGYEIILKEVLTGRDNFDMEKEAKEATTKAKLRKSDIHDINTSELKIHVDVGRGIPKFWGIRVYIIFHEEIDLPVDIKIKLSYAFSKNLEYPSLLL